MPLEMPLNANLIGTKPLAGERGHDRLDRQRSGILVCGLTTLTPVCIMSVFRRLRGEDPPYLPASSLRGMVRNVFEVLGASCLRLVDYPPANAPQALHRCNAGNACLACRVFGFTDGEFSWASKVLFSDAKPIEQNGRMLANWVYCDLTRAATGQPPPANGWRYFPSSKPKRTISSRPGNNLTRCVGAKAQFRFRVDYLNLDPEELSVLIYALTLRHGDEQLCHLLGYAKALGFGASQVKIEKPAGLAPGVEIDRYLAAPEFTGFAQNRRLP